MENEFELIDNYSTNFKLLNLDDIFYTKENTNLKEIFYKNKKNKDEYLFDILLYDEISDIICELYEEYYQKKVIKYGKIEEIEYVCINEIIKKNKICGLLNEFGVKFCKINPLKIITNLKSIYQIYENNIIIGFEQKNVGYIKIKNIFFNDYIIDKNAIIEIHKYFGYILIKMLFKFDNFFVNKLFVKDNKIWVYYKSKIIDFDTFDDIFYLDEIIKMNYYDFAVKIIEKNKEKIDKLEDKISLYDIFLLLIGEIN